MTELILVRHAQPLGGTPDPGLSEVGHRQAQAVAAWLAHDRIDVVVSSGIRRAIETAAPIAAAAGVEPGIVPGLAEWEAVPPRPFYTPLDQFAPDHPAVVTLVEGRYDDFVPPFDHDAFCAGAEQVLHQLFERFPVERIVAVAHGGIINAMLASIIRPETGFFFVYPAYTALSVVERVPSGRIVLRSINETGHAVADRRPGSIRPVVLDG